MISDPITISSVKLSPTGPKTLSSEVVQAGLTVMAMGQFTNMDVAAAFGRAGFEPNDFWIRQEAANRLLQKARKAGLVEFDSKAKWTAVR